jgi:hypothetical protein
MLELLGVKTALYDHRGVVRQRNPEDMRSETVGPGIDDFLDKRVTTSNSSINPGTDLFYSVALHSNPVQNSTLGSLGLTAPYATLTQLIQNILRRERR